MSERILKALMQLFAIIAKVEVNEKTNEISSDEKSRKVVSLFLKQELNQEMVKAYLELFDNYIDTHHGKSKRKDGKRKRTSVNSVKILRICTQINEELKQRQKVIVLIRIIVSYRKEKAIIFKGWEIVFIVCYLMITYFMPLIFDNIRDFNWL